MMYPKISFALALAVALLAAHSLHAAGTIKWKGSASNWNSALNWDLNRLPGNGDTIVIAQSGANVSYDAPSTTANYPIFTVDSANAADAMPTLTLAQAGTTLNTGAMNVGISHKGAVNQSAGAVTVTTFNGMNMGLDAGSTASYSLSGGATLTINSQLIIADTGTATFTQNSGTVDLNYQGFTGAVAIGASTGGNGAYTLSAGTFKAGTLQVSPYGGAGVFTQAAGNVTLSEELDLGDTAVDFGGQATFNHNGGAITTPALNIGRTGVFKQAGGTLKTAAINIDSANGGKLDLTNQSMVVDWTGTSALSAVDALVKSGSANKAWTGSGIRSSNAAADATKHTGIGFGEASDVLKLTGSATANWQGQDVDATSVLVRYTLYGDADLDGIVGLSDLLRLANNYGTNGATWASGDFDGDHIVGLSDLLALANNYGGSLPAAVPGAAPDFAADMAIAFSSVPEPGLAGLLAVGLGTSLLRRRGRQGM